MKLLTRLKCRKIFEYGASYAMAVLLCLCFCACSQKQNAVYDLVKFRVEIEENSESYTESDWENAIEQFVDICQRVEAMEISREERREVNKIKGEVAGLIATAAAQEVDNWMKDIVEEASSFYEGFTDTFELPNN